MPKKNLKPRRMVSVSPNIDYTPQLEVFNSLM